MFRRWRRYPSQSSRHSLPPQAFCQSYLTADGISSPVTTTIAPSFHPTHQNQNRHHNPLLWKRSSSSSPSPSSSFSSDDSDSDDTDGWKYVLRLYACGYRSGDYEDAIQPPPGQICVLDLRDGLYGFCKDPAEKHNGKLNLKRDCGGWRGGCVDDLMCKPDDVSGDKGDSGGSAGPGGCGVMGEGGERKRFEGVETWLVSSLFFSSPIGVVLLGRSNLEIKDKGGRKERHCFEGKELPSCLSTHVMIRRRHRALLPPL
ncbi:hypothetical protein QBC45DRAFT_172791 [Copromyces sp. CBS 386.78]|nr:hypothetical protein QBC45DRAFT_172791 [Copromyces sp. CBS 386.78]